MMAEARRLRERRKALYSRGKDANFAPARAATLETDDAPLMASYSSLPDASRSFSAREKKAAEAFGRDALCFADQAALQSDFPALPAEHTIWVKGSRGAGLEHTVAWLLTSGGATAC